MPNSTRDGRGWQPEFLVSIDGKTCIGCGRCFKVCGRNVMTLRGINDEGEVVGEEDEDEEFEKQVMMMNDSGACIGCGACSRVCPTNCQTHSGAPPALD